MGLCPLCPTDLLVLGDSLEEGPSAGLEQEARGGAFSQPAKEPELE